jgi:signal transduction histidine kinase
LSADVSHELKTPVAGILGQANLLKRWGKENPEQLEKSLDMIIAEANSMNSIITNLLQMSKIEHGIIKPQKESFNIWALFSRLKNEFAGIDSQVLINFDENVDISLETDLELLHQVLTAMISNSIKFGAGQINLYGKVCEDKNDDKGGQTPKSPKICIQVEDDGPGFSEEVLPHIFERFYRGDASHSRSAGGAGLGLSISSVIIDSLGGKILASNSEKTKGALLTILL